MKLWVQKIKIALSPPPPNKNKRNFTRAMENCLEAKNFVVSVVISKDQMWRLSPDVLYYFIDYMINYVIPDNELFLKYLETYQELLKRAKSSYKRAKAKIICSPLTKKKNDEHKFTTFISHSKMKKTKISRIMHVLILCNHLFCQWNRIIHPVRALISREQYQITEYFCILVLL